MAGAGDGRITNTVFERLGRLIGGAGGFALAVLLLGTALQVNFGQYHPLAILLLSAGLFLLLIAVIAWLRTGPTSPDSESRPASITLMWVCLLIELAILLTTEPTAQPIRASLLPFRVGICIAIGMSLLLLGSHGAVRLAAVALPAIYLVIGLWVLRSVPPPPVDVCVFQHDGCAALMHGIDPYSIDFPNLYSDPAKMYGPGLVSAGRVRFGYPYPPLNLFLTLPGYVLGDFRLANLVAMTVAGLLIGLARPTAFSAAAGALLLFTPRTFFILEAGFTEPIVCLLLAGTIFAACRKVRVLPILFGLLLVSKQYMVLAAPLGILLFRTEQRRFGKLRDWFIALATGILVTLPLAAWQSRAFIKSVVTLQFHQPLRSDSLSYLPRLMAMVHWRFLLALPFLAAVAILILALRRFPRTIAGFSFAAALMFAVFFATNKQAFCGYYLLVIAACCCGIATMDLPDSAR
jgi:hypothetical protein